MPELPEVETIVYDLNRKLKNKIIKKVELLDKKILQSPLVEFKRKLIGKNVKEVKRRGKMVIFNLQDNFLVFHLKMTGQMIYQTKKNILTGGQLTAVNNKVLPNKYTRVIFKFNDNSQLFFNDMRRFGWVKLLNQAGLERIFKSLGVEPLSSEFNLEKFKEILSHKKNTTIKQAIMDQKYLSGVGNIYADESLFLAKIRPMRKVKTLTEKQIKKLWQSIPKILKYAIEHRGTTFNDYLDAQGETGNFIEFLKVYGRLGEKCKACGREVEKTKLGGRGTHWCPQCQK